MRRNREDTTFDYSWWAGPRLEGIFKNKHPERFRSSQVRITYCRTR